MCTAITYVSKDHYFGRNFDYEISYNDGWLLLRREIISFHFEKLEI